MDLMAELKDKEFSLACVDPPYGINESKKVQSRPEYVKQKNGNLLYLPRKHKIKQWDNGIPNEQYFNELFRISKNQIIWGGNYFIKYLENTSCFIVWDKLNGNSDFADCELAWTSFNTAVRKVKYMWSGFCQGKNIDSDLQQGNKKLNEQRIHPTQKPVALYRWLLQKYAKPGDTIIDTHSGSASLACACHLEHFNFIAIEKDYDYWKTSVERYERETAQGKFF
jgi:site-specific DNA-methyltransferase (adenine-specific)